ncbi:MAG TPA: DUF3106 domain-containing protein [Thermomonas sp.]|nr:DUF3106 domain-containing protein [Thermomonas sp.]
MNHMIRPVVLALSLLPALAFAQASPAAATQYPEWDQLTLAQRDALVAPLRERWNSNPDERARMLERAQRWKEMPREQRAHARDGMQRWEDMSPEQRSEARALFHAMRGMEKEQRKAFLAQWRQKTPQQKAEWLKAHPAPDRRDGASESR